MIESVGWETIINYSLAMIIGNDLEDLCEEIFLASLALSIFCLHSTSRVRRMITTPYVSPTTVVCHPLIHSSFWSACRMLSSLLATQY